MNRSESERDTKRAFTLIELLVVISIVALLAGISMTVFRQVMAKAEMKKAEFSAIQLKHAIEMYIAEYSGRFPIPPEDHGADSVVKSEAPLMDVLLGLDKKVNPREFPCGEFRRAGSSGRNGLLQNHDLVDPWGKTFCVLLNADGDLEITDPENKQDGGSLFGNVEIFSAGPDGDPETWDDNLKTW